MKDQTESEAIMQALVLEAENNGSKSRLGTLDRLKEACDAVLSGHALKLAREYGWRKDWFMPNRPLVVRSVHEYRKMMHNRSPRTEPTGPTRDTIAHDQGLSSYVRSRETERSAMDRPPRPRSGTRARRSDDIISEKLDYNDQAILRTELADGRLAKRKYDTLAAFFHRLSGVDIGKKASFSFEDVASSIRGQISADDREALSRLANRLHNNEFLVAIGLINDRGSIRTDFGDAVLVRADELRVLTRLAAVDADRVNTEV